jgi:hypothetical protein
MQLFLCVSEPRWSRQEVQDELESEDGIMYSLLQTYYSQRRRKRREIIPIFYALEWSIYDMSPRYK